MFDRVPTDVLGDELVTIYEAATRRLELIVSTGLRRGLDPSRVGTIEQRTGDASHRYRVRQLEQARAVQAAIRSRAANAPVIVEQAYMATLVAVDRSLGDMASMSGRFGGIHQRPVEVLAGNLQRNLDAALDTVGVNVETVFARADALEGALSPGGTVGRHGLVGRRQSDPFREIGLRSIAEDLVAGDVSADMKRHLAQRLILEGATDAITGFVDRTGRRWPLHVYADMVVRTTTREATSRATVNRLAEHGVDLARVSSHPHAADACTPYDGKIFSVSGQDDRYPPLDRLPPFHPRCRHVTGPASVAFEDFEAELDRQARAIRGDTVPEPAPAPPAIGDRVEFSRSVDPSDPARVIDRPLKGTVGAVSPDGTRVMVNTGTAKRPQWREVRTADVGPPPTLTDAPAAPLAPVDELPELGELLRGNKATAAVRRQQTRDLLSTDQRAAITAYQQEGWTDRISRKLRRANDLNGREQNYVDNLDSAFDALPAIDENLQVYRGVGKPFKNVEPGAVIEDPGYGSTSVSKSVADEFARAGGDLFHIAVPKGAKALDVNVFAKTAQQYGTEREILLPRGAKLVVEKITTRKTRVAGPRGTEIVEGRNIFARVIVE